MDRCDDGDRHRSTAVTAACILRINGAVLAAYAHRGQRV